MTTRIPIVPKVVRWARERLNLTLVEAAERLRCDFGTLEKIEDDNDPLRPTATLFRNMARVYLLPEATLLRLEPIQDIPLPKDFRSFGSTSVSLSCETTAAIRRVQARQEALERLAAMDSEVIVPNLPIHSLKESPETLGSTFRRQLGFAVVEQLQLPTDTAFVRWRVLVENLGVSVYIEPLGEDDTRGASLYSNAFPAIIIDQNEKHIGARLFTLFHELCHLLVRQDGISDLNNTNNVERFCNKFAASFLIPKTAVRTAFDLDKIEEEEPEISDLEFAANKLCVTISQIALRLEQLEYVKTGYYGRVIARLSPPSQKRVVPVRISYKYLYLSRAGSNFTSTVLESMKRGQISELNASRILDLSPTHFGAVSEVIEARRAVLVNGQE